jgi:drug/metabolite transporter (DMT)-like permease
MLHEPVGLVASVGIGVLGLGVILMSLKGRRRGAAFDPVAIGFALLTACVISGYTLVDGLGARAAGDPHAYSAAVFVINGIPLPLLVLWRRGVEGVKPALRLWLPGFAGGVMSLGSYWIAIWAMTVAPIALVAALRETSVLFAAIIAVVLLKEPLAPARIAAGVLILAGLALIRLQ